jgi:hypothetical protein
MLKVVGRRVVALFAAIGRGNGWSLGLTATVRTTSPAPVSRRRGQPPAMLLLGRDR